MVTWNTHPTIFFLNLTFFGWSPQQFMHTRSTHGFRVLSSVGAGSPAGHSMCKVLWNTDVMGFKTCHIFFLDYRNFASFPELFCCSHFTFTWCQAQTCAFNLKLFHYLNQILGFDVTADMLQRLRWIALLAKSIWWQVQCINPSVPLTLPVLLGSWFITTSAMTHCSSSRGARMQARRSEKHACYSWSV